MKVMLVEDSRSVRAYVETILRSAEDIVLLPSAVDGREALTRANRERPDVILMDLEIPELDGIACIRAIMESAPCPIIVLSAYVVDRAHPKTFEAFEAGAVDVMRKPEGLTPDAIDRFRGQLLRSVRAMSSARVVRRIAPGSRESTRPASSSRVEAVAIGSSTGGPPIVHRIVSALPPRAECPIVIAQHIVAGFETSFVQWLSSAKIRVVLAEERMRLEPGNVYVLPADRVLRIASDVVVASPESRSVAMPNIDHLFTDLAESREGGVVGILLSGMGSDGTAGAKRIRARGGEVWTQLGSTCVVDGIPGSARRAGASTFELSPDELVDRLARVVVPS